MHSEAGSDSDGARVCVAWRLDEATAALEQDREAAHGAAWYLWPGDCVGGKASARGEGRLTSDGVRLGHELEEGDG